MIWEIFNLKNQSELPLFLSIDSSLLFLIISLFCLYFDKRTLNYSLLWLKPFKFSISTLLYSSTLLYIIKNIQISKQIEIANWIIFLGLFYELFIIFLQAFRGKMSHFNHTTILDSLLFQSMGFVILIVWLMLIPYLINSFSFTKSEIIQRLGIQWGLGICFFTMPFAFVMPSPKNNQLELITKNNSPIGLIIGSNTIHEKDTSQRMPLTSWALTGGDLRISHFFGLHSLQVFPILGNILLKSNISYSEYILHLIAISYLIFCIYTFQQALKGIPLFKI